MAKKNEKAVIKDLQKKIVNQRETVKELNAKRWVDKKKIDSLVKEINTLKHAKVEEISKEILGVYLKYITEQHGEEQYDEETGEALGKKFEFTFQEKNENVFNMAARQNKEGHITMVCTVTYPEKGEDDED